MEETDILQHILLDAKPLSHIPKQEGMGISFSREDPIVEMLPTHIDGVEGNIVVTYRAHPLPHAEGGGAHAPTRGILVFLQEVPQDLIHGCPRKISEQPDYPALQLEGGGREEEQHHLMRGTHPHLDRKSVV